MVVEMPDAVDSGAAGDDGICSPPEADAGDADGGGGGAVAGPVSGPGAVAVAAAVVEIVSYTVRNKSFV